ncbi:MAG: hypothetical protein P8Y45_16465 [Exilibacterium sp.]
MRLSKWAPQNRLSIKQKGEVIPCPFLKNSSLKKSRDNSWQKLIGVNVPGTQILVFAILLKVNIEVANQLEKILRAALAFPNILQEMAVCYTSMRAEAKKI